MKLLAVNPRTVEGSSAYRPASQNTADHFARLILVRCNNEAEGRRARTESVQRLMRGLQTGLASVQLLRVPDGNCESHFIILQKPVQ
jgi:hypothetical protein